MGVNSSLPENNEVIAASVATKELELITASREPMDLTARLPTSPHILPTDNNRTCELLLSDPEGKSVNSRTNIPLELLRCIAYAMVSPTPFVMPSLAGMALARWRLNPGLLGLVVGLYLLNFWSPTGIYRYFWLAYKTFPRFGMEIFNDVVYTLGAALVVGYSASLRFDHWIACFLGRISFPVYLVHTPVLCSLGTFVIVKSGSVAMTAACVWCAILVAAMALARFDRWWVGVVNRWVVTGA